MKVLILLDGSEFAEAVLEPVAELANRAMAEVHFLQVLKPSEAHATWGKLPAVGPDWMVAPYMTGISPGPVRERVAVETQVQAEERAYQETEEYLNGIAGRFFPRGSTKEVAFGEDPVEVIAGYAKRHGIDLIALATHGRTGLSRLLMGSVAGSLLKAHVAPLCIERPDGLGGRDPDAVA